MFSGLGELSVQTLGAMTQSGCQERVSGVFFPEFMSLSLLLLFSQTLQLLVQDTKRCLEPGLISQIMNPGILRSKDAGS